MGRKVTQRELRNDSGEIMRGLDRGESYIVTRNGVPVGELRPIRQPTEVPIGQLQAALAGVPRIDAAEFLRDVRGVFDEGYEFDPYLERERRRHDVELEKLTKQELDGAADDG